MFAAPLRLLVACPLVAFAACGAKTALDVPDAPIDAERDAGLPVSPPSCIVVTPDDPTVTVDLEIPARLRVVDVMFLIDSSASMLDEIGHVRARLRDVVVPGIRALIPDAAFGVAIFGEFPVFPHARPGADVGPYQLRVPITRDIPRIESGLSETPVWGNLDDPEAAIEGLYQVATGEGLAPWIPESSGCPMGGIGGPCFRTEAFRIVMLVTDAPMHNGPPDVPPVAPYRFTPSPHTYEQTIAAARAAELFVIGLGASDPGRPSPFPHLRAVGRDTRSVDSSGDPIVFDIGTRGDRIGVEIVRAVRRVAEDVLLDVDAAVEDRPGDDVDARDVMRGLIAVSADPPGAVGRIEESRFVGVRPGTRLTFRLEVDVRGLPPSPMRREFWGRVVFRAAGRSRIEVRDVVVVVPGEDGVGCEEPGVR